MTGWGAQSDPAELRCAAPLIFSRSFGFFIKCREDVIFSSPNSFSAVDRPGIVPGRCRIRTTVRRRAVRRRPGRQGMTSGVATELRSSTRRTTEAGVASLGHTHTGGRRRPRRECRLRGTARHRWTTSRAMGRAAAPVGSTMAETGVAGERLSLQGRTRTRSPGPGRACRIRESQLPLPLPTPPPRLLPPLLGATRAALLPTTRTRHPRRRPPQPQPLQPQR